MYCITSGYFPSLINCGILSLVNGFVFGSTLEMARTVAFMQVCIFELVVVWNCRSERHNAFKVGFFSNKFLLVAVLASFVLTVSLCYVPVFQLMFSTVPLEPYDWIWILATSSLGFAVLPEVFMRRRKPAHIGQRKRFCV